MNMESKERKYTKEQLIELQNKPLSEKISISLTRILETVQIYGNKIYVSFSGGIDSTVGLHLVRRLFPDALAVYIDTGLEYPEIKQFVKATDNVKIIRPEMSFKQVIEKYGYPIISKEVSQRVKEARSKPDGKVAERFNPDCEHYKKYGKQYDISKWAFLLDAPFKVSNQCCNVMKKKPAKKFEKETGYVPFVFTMASESRLRKTDWLRHGCNAFDCDRPVSHPMSFWTKQDVLEYIVTYNVPYCDIYGDILQDENGKYYTTGVDRTGCVFCLYGIQSDKEPNRLQRLAITHNDLYKYCLKPVEENGLGEGQVLDYLNQHGIKINY